MKRNLEAKHEKIIKELLRQGPNRRCVDCDSVGPQYVLSTFNTFICTTCSGVHRQFGHRVKGISMCTFNAEEVAALQSGGNERFFATYCATWTPASLPRPTDRHPERTREWIEAVYQAKRFYADIPADFAAPEGSPKAVASGAGASVASTASVNGDNEVAVLALEGLPRLQLSIPKPAAPATSAQSASSPAKAASQVASPTSKEPEPVSAPAAAAPVAEAPLVVPVAEPLPVAPAAEVWDPFAAPPEPPAPQPPIPEVKVAEATLPELQPAAAAATATTKAPAPAVPATNVTADDGASWAAFGDAFPQEPAVDAMSALASLNVPAPAPAPAPAANGSTERGAPGAVPVATPAANGNGGWHAFEAQAAASSGASTPSSVAPQNGAAVAAPVLPQAPVAAKPPSPPVNQRQEVPLDVFYPEFAKIRATGVLPTGQLVPADPLTGLSPAAFAMPQAASPYGHPSPAAAHAGMHQYGTPSPGAYAAHAAFSPPTMLSIPSPAGMAYPSPQQPWQQQPSPSPLAFGSPQVAAYGAAGQGGWGHPSPAVSMTPGQQYGAPSPAVPPARQQQQQQQPKLGADPFDGLGSVLGGALSSPAPQQAGNGFHAAVKPAPAVQMPATSQTAAASATLFGVNTAIGAYDLSAPAAPKAKATGNPFA